MGLGSFINSITGASNSAKQSYKYSSWLASQNNEFQKEMAKNAHQWEIEDLQKAGLNPVLSAGGSGASAGGFGGGSSVGMQAGAGGLSDIINSAGGLLKLSSEIENLDQDTELKGAITGKTPHEIKEIQSRTNRNIEETKEVSSKIMVNTATALERRMRTALTWEQKKRIKAGKLGELLGTGGIYDYIYPEN